jgi:hypothetical protein
MSADPETMVTCWQKIATIDTSDRAHLSAAGDSERYWVTRDTIVCSNNVSAPSAVERLIVDWRRRASRASCAK